MARYGRVEPALIAHLTTATGRPVFTETPDDLDQYLPAYQVGVVGGADPSKPMEERTVTVEVIAYAATRPLVWAAAEDADDAMHRLAGQAPTGVYVDDARNTFVPAIQAHQNPGIRACHSMWAITLRPRQQ